MLFSLILNDVGPDIDEVRSKKLRIRSNSVWKPGF